MSEDKELSEYCLSTCGLDVGGVAEQSGVSRRTLYNWWGSRRRTVELITIGLVGERYLNEALFQPDSVLSDYCLQTCNLDVTEVADQAGLARRTLYNWWESRKRAVELIVVGLVAERYLKQTLWHPVNINTQPTRP